LQTKKNKKKERKKKEKAKSLETLLGFPFHFIFWDISLEVADSIVGPMNHDWWLKIFLR
jgi:hypothetical protein